MTYFAYAALTGFVLFLIGLCPEDDHIVLAVLLWILLTIGGAASLLTGPHY